MMNTATVLFLLTSYLLLNRQAQGVLTFSPDTYATTIPENVTIGSSLDLGIQVNSTDGNIPSYSIPPSERITAFSINNLTGIISVAQSLDYEMQTIYQFSVAAAETSATASVTISVSDVNDNQPVFGMSVYSVIVSEDQPQGAVIALLTAIDADSGTNAQLSYSIAKGNEERIFALNSLMGLLTITSTLDRETRASYSLIVQATDGGEPPLSSNATVMISVSDANDNAPVFEQASYTTTLPFVSLREWSFNITATDQDSGENAEISYSIIEGNEAGIFNIDQASGEIFVAEPFDPEVVQNFTLTVQAMDSGVSIRNSDLARVTINVDTSSTTSATTEEQTGSTMVITTDRTGSTMMTTLDSSTITLHCRQLVWYSTLPSLMLFVSAALSV